MSFWASRWLTGKESTCQWRSHRRQACDPWVWEIPCRWKWQPFQYSCLDNSTDRGATWARKRNHGVWRVEHDWAHTHACILLLFLLKFAFIWKSEILVPSSSVPLSNNEKGFIHSANVRIYKVQWKYNFSTQGMYRFYGTTDQKW